ncbi:MAG: energy transducer TonB, partial [Alphaproteobacteria bacterium]
FARAWKAYQKAVQDKAPAAELLPLAQAVYDALPADPDNPKEQRLKAAAAFNLGAALRDLGESDKAYERFRESLDLFEAALGKDAPELVDPLWELARLDLKVFHREVAATKKVHRIDTILAGQGDAMLGLRVVLHNEWANAFFRHQEPELAKAHLGWLEKNAARLPAQSEIILGDASFLRGKMAAGNGRFREAVKRYREAREHYLASLPARDRRVLIVDQFLVVALEELGKSEEATAYCQEIGRYQPPRPDSDYMPLFRRVPDYPPDALNRGIGGYVVVSLTVTADGRTRDIRVIESNPPRIFDRAAIEAARQFRYAPRFADGRPVDTPDVRYKFAFVID